MSFNNQAESEFRIVSAECKVARQSLIVHAMHDDDPALPFAKVLLKQMVLSATSAQMTHAMLEYIEGAENNDDSPTI